MNRVGFLLAVGVALVWTFGSANGQATAPSNSSRETAPYPPPPPPSLGGATTSPSDEQFAAASPSESAPESAAPAAEEAPKPWTIPQPRFLADHKINMGGWLQQGITLNAWDPADRYNGPIATNDRSGEYQLNQLWLYFVRPTKTDGCGFDIGGRVDVVYGEDWRFGQCTGLETRFDSPNSFYGLVLPQFYLEVAYNDLTVKMGHFATLTSMEVVPAPANFFYSHSYLMTGYFDPLLVTGLQAEYKLTDNWTAVGGFNRGWQFFENPFGTLNFLGGAKWASDDKRSVFSLMVIDGPTMTFGGFHDETSVIMYYTHQFNERLSWGSQVTVGTEAHGATIPGHDRDTWYGTEQILTYKLNPKWGLGMRYEWVQDNAGSRIAGIGNVLGTDKGWGGLPGFAGSFSDLSLGVNYRLNPNFILRPEVRWDWYSGNPNPAGQLPFGDLAHSTQFTTGLDLVATF